MNSPPTYNKTRIAPTPSGYLHLGNALSFSMTALLAQRTGAKILLRIDDLDRDRVDPAYIKDIFDTLDFLKIRWQEGPGNMEEYEAAWSQLYRMEMYWKALQQLRDDGHLFACTCSRAQLLRENAQGVYPGTCRDKGISLDEKDVSWRLRTDPAMQLSVRTWQGATIQATLPPSMQDFIVKKKDNFPAYQLTSLLDDLHFGVDLIVRGEDLWPSTLAQHYLATLLQQPAFGDAAFCHHPLLEASPGKKLSKSAGDTSIRSLRQQGLQRLGLYRLLTARQGIKEPPRSVRTALCLLAEKLLL